MHTQLSLSTLPVDHTHTIGRGGFSGACDIALLQLDAVKATAPLKVPAEDKAVHPSHAMPSLGLASSATFAVYSRPRDHSNTASRAVVW